jgi:histidine phosphotransfer protein HptB
MVVADEALIDPQAWEALVAQLCGSVTIAGRFIADFIHTWPVRLDRLNAALEAEDAEDAYVTLLSIRSGSEMVGAARLAVHAARLEAAAHAGRLAECVAGVATLRALGDQTMAALVASHAPPVVD